ncbi:hypothetical protein J1N35_028823 [Gossypium stocksii]|uniref:Uncharacterized protein n=1 Tax=Gossypium stocksii TaxID=47602 RepID=A0A9D3UWY3_9ROSI|nr:hypothetical protein J1N35_028823 [Gossypium stocksii]
MKANDVKRFPFLETKVIQQACFDHDAIILDTEGRKPRENIKGPRLCFKFENCWAKDKEAKMIIKAAWQREANDTLDKIKTVSRELGEWQLKKLKEIWSQIKYLQETINKTIDNQGSTYQGNNLKALRSKLGNLLDKEEKYWAQ